MMLMNDEKLNNSNKFWKIFINHSIAQFVSNAIKQQWVEHGLRNNIILFVRKGLFVIPCHNSIIIQQHS